MYLVPVAHQRQNEKHERDQQQARGFRSVDGMAPLLLRVGLRLGDGHAPIVAPNTVLARDIRTAVLNYGVVPQNHSRIARFGVFELDLNAGELRKSGVKLRLQGQPFQVLALLLERAGEVVTREELRQKLWPSDTFVDFDHSVNTAINKVREALGDSASSPRYVETLARRGYRFIAPLQKAVPQDAADARRLASTRSDGLTSSAAMHPELDVPIPHRGVTRGLFVLIQVMYLSFYLAALFRLHAVLGVADELVPVWGVAAFAGVLLVTAGVGIALRCYLISAAGFDYQRLGEKFGKIFPFLLLLDELWAVAPFLLMHKIGLGAAFAASAALVYVPFSERTLVRMAYLGRRVQSTAE